MKKKDGLTNLAKQSLTDSFKCGECLHFKSSAHRSNEDLCSKLGVRAFAIAPKCYTPDYTKLIHNSDELVALSALFTNYTPAQKRILLGMLRMPPKGKKYRLGTKLYLKSSTRDYISNYMCGYVVGYSSANELILAGSPDSKSRGRLFFAYLKSDLNLLTQKQWREKFLDLKGKGKINDPVFTKKRDITAKSIEENTYEVPTIDNMPKEGTKPAKKMSKRTTPLTMVFE